MGRSADSQHPYAWALAAMLAGSAVLVSLWTVDAFMLPKLTFMAVGVVVVLALWMWKVAGTSRLSLPMGWPVVSVAVFMAASAVVTVTSTHPWLSLVGVHTRYSGLLSYLTYGCVFLLAVAVAERHVLLSRSVLVSAAPCLLLGFMQAAGLHPLGVDTRGLPGAIATFGNVNFAGAWAGMVAALAISTALAREERRAWRTYATLLVPILAIYCVLTTTSQALVVFLACSLFVCLVIAGSNQSLRAQLGRHGWRAALGIGLLAGGVSLWAFTNRSRIGASLDQALVERPYFWGAALRIWSEHPFLGTGLDTYGQFFPAYRSPEHEAIEGAGTADAPHSVFLAMLSNGGVLLAIAYLAFVVIVGVLLVRRLVFEASSREAQLVGWGGVWVGYQVQSLVSYDVPALALLHFVAAGVLVGQLGGVRWTRVELPDVANWRGSATRSRAVRRRSNSRVLKPVAIVAAVSLGWLAVQPLRADVVAASAEPLTRQGRYAEAAMVLARAAEIDPSNAEYLALAARAYASSGRLNRSLQLMKEAAHRSRGRVDYPFFTARIAAELGQERVAAAWYREATQRDPYRVEVLSEASQFFLEVGKVAAAERLASRAVAVDPENVEARELLEQAEARSASSAS